MEAVPTLLWGLYDITAGLLLSVFVFVDLDRPVAAFLYAFNFIVPLVIGSVIIDRFPHSKIGGAVILTMSFLFATVFLWVISEKDKFRTLINFTMVFFMMAFTEFVTMPGTTVETLDHYYNPVLSADNVTYVNAARTDTQAEITYYMNGQLSFFLLTRFWTFLAATVILFFTKEYENGPVRWILLIGSTSMVFTGYIKLLAYAYLYGSTIDFLTVQVNTMIGFLALTGTWFMFFASFVKSQKVESGTDVFVKILKDALNGIDWKQANREGRRYT